MVEVAVGAPSVSTLCAAKVISGQKDGNRIAVKTSIRTPTTSKAPNKLSVDASHPIILGVGEAAGACDDEVVGILSFTSIVMMNRTGSKDIMPVRSEEKRVGQPGRAKLT